MQRIAALLLCAMLWTPNASAQDCDELGDIIAGFAGGATGYGLLTNLGPATSWISAGLYGAGMAVATVVGNGVAEIVCENFEDILETTALIYCAAGEYVCDFVDDVTISLIRDFQICPSCRPDEIFGAFWMDDFAREDYLRNMQERHGSPFGHLGVLPRNHAGPLAPAVLDAYYVGMQAGFSQKKALRLRSLAY